MKQLKGFKLNREIKGISYSGGGDQTMLLMKQEQGWSSSKNSTFVKGEESWPKVVSLSQAEAKVSWNDFWS